MRGCGIQAMQAKIHYFSKLRLLKNRIEIKRNLNEYYIYI